MTIADIVAIVSVGIQLNTVFGGSLKVTRVAKSILVISLITFLGVFGTSILNNIHNTYLRFLSHQVVKLTNSTGRSGATGFVVKGKSGKKYIMTNNHVCGLAENGALTAEYRGEKFQVSIVKRYIWNDLCALEAHRPLGLAVNIAGSASLGDNAWVIGHPLLEPLTVAVGELSGTVFIDVITGYNPAPGECEGPTYRLIDLSGTLYNLFGVTSVCLRTLEANASTMGTLPGNSGSPAVNLWGSVVAVCFAGNESGSRGYFVPLEDLKQFLSEL